MPIILDAVPRRDFMDVLEYQFSPSQYSIEACANDLDNDGKHQLSSALNSFGLASGSYQIERAEEVAALAEASGFESCSDVSQHVQTGVRLGALWQPVESGEVSPEEVEGVLAEASSILERGTASLPVQQIAERAYYEASWLLGIGVGLP